VKKIESCLGASSHSQPVSPEARLVGVHYPSDSKAGKDLADFTFPLLLACEARLCELVSETVYGLSSGLGSGIVRRASRESVLEVNINGSVDSRSVSAQPGCSVEF